MEERRIVTVLFCDVTGSTALAGQIELEEWAEVIAEAFPLLIEPIERYGGTVARLMGDAVLAFFGAPVAHEDDPQRAILAALAMLEGLQTFQEQFKRDYGHDFNIRVGINTGDVIVGAFGTMKTFEYTAMGDAVNVAARMEQMAAPGTIQVAAPTYRLAAPYFSFEPLGEMIVRGKDEPIEAFRVLNRLAEPARYRHLEQIMAPTTGRERELALLNAALDQLHDGQGGIVSLIGDAGLGKSRLLEDLRRRWLGTEQEHVRSSWVEHRLASYESRVPYVLFRRWIGRDLHLEDGAPESGAKSTITDAIEAVSPKDDRMIEAVTKLFEQSAPSDDGLGSGSVGVEPDDFREELVDLVEMLWRRWIGKCGGGVYVVDDFHCVDPASAELMEAVLERAADLPLLVLLAFRPDHDASTWSLHQRLAERYPDHYRTVTLAPLDQDCAAALIDSMFEGAKLPQGFRQAILEKVGGNPLFAEEMVRSLVEQGVVQPVENTDGQCWTVADDAQFAEIKIPESLQTLIQDRVDRLNPEARQTLQLASVFGTSFSREDLVSVSDAPEQIPERLEALRAAILIGPSDPQNPNEFAFHHALIWETVYGSILRRHRRRLHRQIGESLERRFRGQLNESRLALLSQHFAEGRDARAVTYSAQAGDRAMALYAPEEAIEFYTRALDVADNLNVEHPAIHVFRQRGLALRTIGEYELAREDLHRALELARSASDVSAECQALIDIGESWEGIDYQRAGQWYEEALESTEKSGDQKAIAQALTRMGNWYSNVQCLDDARTMLEHALEIYQHLDDKRGLADTLTRLGLVELMAGNMKDVTSYRLQAASIFEELEDQIQLSSTLAGAGHAAGTIVLWASALSKELPTDKAFEIVERSLELARAAGWRSGESYALQVISMLASWRGHFDRAIDASHAGLAIAKEIKHQEWTVVGHIALGSIHQYLLEFDEAIAEFQEARRIAGESNVTSFLSVANSYLAYVYLNIGDQIRAAQILNEFPRDIEVTSVIGRGSELVRAELAVAEGNPSRALEIVDRLYETAANCTEPADIPILAELHGRALIELGRYEKARESVEAARKGAEALGPRPVLWQVHVDLARLHSLAGDEDEANRELERAHAEVTSLSLEISDQDRRSAFLERAAKLISTA